MAYSDQILADAPALYWRLEETEGVTAVDSSGNVRDGEYKSEPTLGLAGPLVEGDKAVGLEAAANERITSNFNPFVIGQSLTLECWAYLVPNATNNRLIGSSGTNRCAISITNGASPVSVNFTADSVEGGLQTWSAALPTETWTHLVVVFNNAENTVELFVNGVSQGTREAAKDFGAAPGTFQGGTAGAVPWNGRIDEVAAYEYALSAERVRAHFIAAITNANVAAGLPAPMSGIRVVAVGDRGEGDGFDLTDEIEGLGWSSVSSGGDETCTFTFKRSWFAENPEIEKGNLLRVMDGVDVLWQGRIDEVDRSGEDTEQIGVTAYGLGIRLKEQTMREIYRDPSFERWGPVSNQRRVNSGSAINYEDPAVVPDPTSGTPRLETGFTGQWSTEMRSEAWYDADGITIGIVSATWERNPNTPSGGSIDWRMFLSDDGELSSFDLSTETKAAGPGEEVLPATTITRTFAVLRIRSAAAGGEDGKKYSIMWVPVVEGAHGLQRQEGQVDGYFNSQMIADAIGRAEGIVARLIEPTSYVNEQAAFFDETAIETVVSELNKFERHHRTYGTWGPDSPLDNSIDGYFDYRELETDPSWIVYREECDSCNLHSELASLFDTLHVTYADSSGVQRQVTRTAVVPDLNGIPREETIDAGKATKAGAETLGDAVLALSGTFAPARGTAVISRPVRHVDRGWLPAHYMRADGSAFRVPDILPASSLFALDSSPNRRTTFPIKRIGVDATQPRPKVTVEVDQANDAISAMEARLAQSAQLRGG